MNITKISRGFSRSTLYKRPDGTEMWTKHEMTLEAAIDSDTDDVAAVSAGLEEVVRKEVNASVKAEKAKIEKVKETFEPPFPDDSTPSTKARKMAKL